MEPETIDAWLERLAARTPTPGGGGAAALLAATAAALVGMVSNYTTGGKWSDREAVMLEIADGAAELRTAALLTAEADELAFAQVGAAYKLPKSSDAEKVSRRAAIQNALRAAAEPPVETGRIATQVVDLAQQLVVDGNPNVISDVAVAASAAGAALEAAIVNIEINAASIDDPAVRAELTTAVQEFEAALVRVQTINADVRKAISR